MDKQHTIRNSIALEGVGLHSGKLVEMTLLPAPPDTGIVFRRVDLDPVVDLLLKPQAIVETPMCTTLVQGEVKISTIEHLTSALCALAVDNVIVEVNAPELPVMDGSAAPFIFALESAGIELQQATRRYLKILKPVRVEDEDGAFAALGPRDDGFHLTVEIVYDHPVLAATPSEVSFELSRADYIKEVSRARTYGFVKDLDYLHEHNLALGASLENAVGVTDDGVMNPEGLRYRDEFVRHKLLDAIGDLYAVGPIVGSFHGRKCGHRLNNQVLCKLLADEEAYHWVD